MSTTRWEDKLAIREVIENWIVFSDSGFWDEFGTVWHEGADMSATWREASADDFMAGRREGWEKGVSIIHALGGTSLDLVGRRAIAQTKMTISQRAEVHGVEVDVVCTGRFYDFFEERDGRWAIVHRRCIYEKDRMDPTTPGAGVDLDRSLLDSFPYGYRHLAYLQTQIGYEVKGPPRPGMKGPEVEALYAQGREWLNDDS
ncbi:nuclear transport factor 2 family protein [Arthrobacter echini]|uniref:Nuclear transport factor 2 family protein n=1 Tax=Arthrobacter echini TaxID=1529066 RepID=A0A4S5E679_9MICC|nr:nuclear transport factor 2 family protein [Arthrobacter echini]THJ66960.1 nuclear transport factor 2 family protein [Arthrobacter echini]